jgi:hypothetical protein
MVAALWSGWVWASSSALLQTDLNLAGLSNPLKTWSISDLENLRYIHTQEKSPLGKTVSWKGPLLSSVVEKTIENLPPEQKAQVDLLVFTGVNGEKFQLPRWLTIKYPVLLAVQNGALKLVLPWTSKPKIWEEGLPLNRIQMRDIARVEFASYHQAYGSLYLKRRTDPLALRGEKIFVQNCTACHSMGIEKTTSKLSSSGHPAMIDSPRLQSRDVRALESYFDAYKVENPISGASASSDSATSLAAATTKE